jgi:hypothetical protein
MGSIIKTISLDGECLKIAEKIENFSGWVRAQLIKFDEENNPSERYSYACYMCERVFTYDSDKGEESYCRNKRCTDYGHAIGRYDND